MRARKHAKTFASAKASKARAILYRKISKRRNLAARQLLQLQVRFAEHDAWLTHLKNFL